MDGASVSGVASAFPFGQVDSRTVECFCDAPMKPQIGWLIEDDARRWFFWRCEKDHVTFALPIPDDWPV